MEDEVYSYNQSRIKNKCGKRVNVVNGKRVNVELILLIVLYFYETLL